MAVTERQITEFLEQRLGLDAGAVGPSTPLFSSGLLDSFSMVDLISFVESTAGFRMRPSEVSLENLDSVERIVRFSARRGADA